MSDEKENNHWPIVIAIIALIYFLNKIFGDGEADEQHKETEEKAARARTKMYKEIPPSFSDQQYRDWADIIDKAILRQATEDEEAVYKIFQQQKNLSDIYKIIEMFGHRREMFSTYMISLPQAIHTFFNRSEKDTLNYILRSKKINYTFD